MSDLSTETVGADEKRAKNPANVDRMTLKDALDKDPTYRHLSSKIGLLKECLKAGSIAWMRVEPVSTEFRPCCRHLN
jgi:hypothetical protein